MSKVVENKGKVFAAEEEEEDLVDPQTVLREECNQKHCKGYDTKLQECNSRVSGRTQTMMSNTDNMKTYAVIPAAGSGHRFDESDSLPKQYSTVCDKPLIYHTINSFLRIEWIDKIIIVSDSVNQHLMKQIIDSISHQNRIEIVIGSTSRHRSIAKGIESIGLNNWPQPDIIVVHDGARPFLEEHILKQLVSSALKYGGCGVICKLTSTILLVTEDKFMDRALDRNKYYASETPQAFKYVNIKEAYNRCSEHDFDFNTECLDLVQRYTSTKVKLIEVNPSQYFKVTFKKDVFGAEGILRGFPTNQKELN